MEAMNPPRQARRDRRRLSSLVALLGVAILVPSRPAGAQEDVAGITSPESPQTTADAPPSAARPFDPRRSLTASLGLIQPFVLGGANVELDFRFRRLVLAYSHGWSLDVPTTGAMKEQHLVQQVPVTTGLGVGIQHYVPAANLMFDVRAEFKYHRFEFALENQAGDARRDLVGYGTFTVGGGAYVTWLPFARSDRGLRGIALALSFRVWPRVASTLRGDRLEYANETTGRTEIHRAADVGIANTPFIVNLSLGYAFGLGGVERR